MDQDTMLIYIDNNNPVELNNLVESMNGLLTLYKVELEQNSAYDNCPVRLIVDKVENGSIKLFLKDSFQAIEPSLSAIASFGGSLFKILEYFKTKKGEKPEMTKQQLDALHKFASVTASDVNGNIYMEVNNYSYNYGSTEANAMQNEIRKLVNELSGQTPEFFSMVGVRWADANFVSKKQHGKIIIEKISRSPKNVVFMQQEDWEKCTSNREDHPDTPWQKFLYFADVEVVYVGAKIHTYKILKLYESAVPLE